MRCIPKRLGADLLEHEVVEHSVDCPTLPPTHRGQQDTGELLSHSYISTAGYRVLPGRNKVVSQTMKGQADKA